MIAADQLKSKAVLDLNAQPPKAAPKQTAPKTRAKAEDKVRPDSGKAGKAGMAGKKTRSSSKTFSTVTGSVLHDLLRTLQPGHA